MVGAINRQEKGSVEARNLREKAQMTTKDVLALALEALEHLQPSALTSFHTISVREKAITAIKQAQEQKVKQELQRDGIQVNQIASLIASLLATLMQRKGKEIKERKKIK